MLQANGQISLAQIGTEFGDSPPFSMSEFFGVDAGVPASGNPLSLTTFYSKGNAFVVSITSNQLQLDLRAWLLANGWDGIRLAKVTIETGVYIWSDNTSVAALSMGGTYPNGLTLINKGFIIGKGGNGGSILQTVSNGAYDNITNPTVGGPAISLTGPITIDNADGYIGGGGGGGAGAPTSGGGGGAGGGLGGKTQTYIANALSYTDFGAPGAIGQNGSYVFVNNNSLTGFVVGQHSGAGGGGSFTYYPITI